jgi:hypothetical protein
VSLPKLAMPIRVKVDATPATKRRATRARKAVAKNATAAKRRVKRTVKAAAKR